MIIEKGFKAVKIIKGLKALNKTDNKAEAAKYIEELFSDEKGLFFKIGQYMGANPNAVKEIKKLSSRVKSHDNLDELKLKIQHYFKKDWDEIFLSIDSTSFSASLAEVYPATLLDGTKVAIKTQTLGIKEEVKGQLKLLGFMPTASKFSPIAKWGFDVKGYIDMIYSTLDDELDYIKEVNKQLKFQLNNSSRPEIITSKIYEEYSFDTIYLQSYLEGEHIGIIKKTWSKEDRRDVAKKLLKSFLETLFIDGHIQADTNHGNFLFSKNNIKEADTKVIYLDFGNFSSINEIFRKNLYNLVHSTIYQSEIDPIGYMIGMGLDGDKIMQIHSALPVLCNAILKPFISQYAFDMKNWDLKHDVDMILGENKWWFRSAGSVEFFTVLKSFLGFKNFLELLDVNISWQECFMNLDFSKKEEWIEYTPVVDVKTKYNFKSISKNLYIQIKKNDKIVVDLQFPIATLVDLESYVEDDVKLKLAESGINLKDLITKSLSSGCRPGDIFKLEVDEMDDTLAIEKEYHIWLN